MAATSETASTLQPLCPVHSEQVAHGNCERCGRYVCEYCVKWYGFCQQCVRWSVTAAHSSEVRARWAVRFLRLSAALALVEVLIHSWMLFHLWWLFEYDEHLSPGAWSVILLGFQVFTAMDKTVFVAMLILFMRWLLQVVRQVNAWGKDVGASPRWAVGCWFVPLVNLVKPFLVMRGILEQLGGKALAASVRLGVWWGTFLLGRVLARQLAHMSHWSSFPRTHPWHAVTVYLLGIASSLCLIITALLCARIILAVQHQLDSRRAGLVVTPSA